MRRILTIVLMLLLFSPVALGGLYVGGSVGNADTEITDSHLNFDEGDTAWKIFVGYSILEFLAVEGGYVDFGSPDARIHDVNIQTDTSGLDAFAVGKLPVGPVELFAKLGLVDWDTDVALSGDIHGNVSEGGTDLAYGLGLAFNVSKIAIRVEAEKFDTGNIEGAKTDLFMLSAGVEFRW